MIGGREEVEKRGEKEILIVELTRFTDRLDVGWELSKLSKIFIMRKWKFIIIEMEDCWKQVILGERPIVCL